MGKLSFGSTGLSYQVDKVALKVGGAPKCPRCNKSVYFNEEKKAMNKSWHSKCFTCAKCNKSLDSTNANNHEDEVYCTMCHRREFGPKGYGFAGGAAGLSTDSTFHKVRPVSPVQTTAVPRLVPSKNITPGDPECCPRCGKPVYFAEEVKAMKRKWHRLCFKCATCNKMLEPGRCSEHEGELYCQACYGRQFGPVGYGYGGGAGQTLSSDVHPYYPNFGRKSRLSRSSESDKSFESEQRWTQASSSGTPSPGASSSSSVTSPPNYNHNPNSRIYQSATSQPPQVQRANHGERVENEYAQAKYFEEKPYPTGLPTDSGSSRYYGAKEWNEPVFL